MKKHVPIINLALLFLLVFFAPACKEEVSVTQSKTETKQTYTCSMHPQIVSDKPGTCPICAMDLVLFDKSNAAGDLTLNAAQQAVANITTDSVRSGSFSSFKQLNGRIAVNPEQTEFISARVAGRVERLYVKQTDVPVRRGQPLYTIYSEQLAALQKEYLVAVAQAVQFPGDTKFEQLASAAKQRLQLLGQSDAQLQQLSSRKETSPYVTYSATTSGVISELFIAEGQYVSEGAPVMSVENYGNVWVEADVYPAEAELVRQGSMLTVRVAGFENEPLKMRIDFIAPSLQAGSQLLTIRGSLPNAGNRLRPGMQAVVQLPVVNYSTAITLPVDAVIHDSRGSHVWLQHEAGKYKPQRVETGAENFDRIEIKSGVIVGDVVVVSGAYLLYSEYILKKGKDPMERR